MPESFGAQGKVVRHPLKGLSDKRRPNAEKQDQGKRLSYTFEEPV